MLTHVCAVPDTSEKGLFQALRGFQFFTDHLQVQTPTTTRLSSLLLFVKFLDTLQLVQPSVFQYATVLRQRIIEPLQRFFLEPLVPHPVVS